MVENVYVPKQLEQFLSCKLIKDIREFLEYYEENLDGFEGFDSMPTKTVQVRYSGEEINIKDISLKSLDIELKLSGVIKLKHNQLIQSDENGWHEKEVFIEITLDNKGEVQRYIDEYISSPNKDFYLYQTFDTSLYVTSAIVNREGSVYEIKDNIDNLVLCSGIDIRRAIGDPDDSYLRMEILKTYVRMKKPMLSTYFRRGIDLEVIGYSMENLCDSCKDKCFECLCGKPTEVEFGYTFLYPDSINDEILMVYLEYLKQRIKDTQGKIVELKNNGRRLTTLALLGVSYDDNFHSLCPFMLSIACYNALALLSKTDKTSVIRNTIFRDISEGEIKSFQRLVNIYKDLSIDLFEELNVPSYLKNKFHNILDMN